MNWYYSLNSQQAGPIAEGELSRLISTGVLTGATLVWREGLPDWQPISAVLPSLTNASDAPQLGGFAVPAAQKDLLVQQMREGVASTAPGSMHYGGFWIRVVAKILDSLILQAVQFVLSLIGVFVIGAMHILTQDTQVILSLSMTGIGLAISFGYQTLMLGKYGATLGKMALGLRVVRPDGSPVSMGQAAGRFFGEMLSGLILGIGYIMVAFDEEKRGLHDRVCNTRVIYKAR